MTTTNPYVNAKLAKHRALAAEWQQGWNNAAAGKGLISVNGEWMAGWHAYERERTTDLLERSLTVLDESDNADEHRELIRELREALQQS